ncbi:hypothetical protein TI05_12355 [Achromatium sp. WMS3]|nr:hypothetical protein TI05_12355 [Achromatium sp. WMS3]
MQLLIVTFMIFIIAILGMALGVIFGGRKRCLRGSCGGINQATGEKSHCMCSKEAHHEHP